MRSAVQWVKSYSYTGGVSCRDLLYNIMPVINSKVLCAQKFAKRTVQFRSVAQSCLTLCDPMNRSTPGLAVHQQLLEFTQTHAHQVGDAIQSSHPL